MRMLTLFRMRVWTVAIFAFCLSAAFAEVFFEEHFDEGWRSRWVDSTWKASEGTLGKFVHTAGPYYGDAVADKGIQTSQDARFYGISAKLPHSFSNKGKDLVVQFNVRHPQSLDCGGGYIKLAPSTTPQANFGGDSPYSIMFGPDMCGATRKTHAIFNYKGKNLENKKSIRCESDQLNHLYTLIVRPDNTYEVQIDQVKVEGGNLEDDYDFLPPKTIKDPKQSKPSDWVDEAKIPDPEDQKPEGWDDIPEEIADPDAVKPEEWLDEDGEWEPPMIRNPAYKGEWKPRMIDNPDYKGEWVHPLIANPAYAPDANLYNYPDLGLVGIELWQVKSGTIFDNIFVSDDVNAAKAFAAKTWKATKDKEKAMFDAAKEKERVAQEEARKAAEANNAATNDSPDFEDDTPVEKDDAAKMEERRRKLAELHDDEL